MRGFVAHLDALRVATQLAENINTTLWASWFVLDVWAYNVSPNHLCTFLFVVVYTPLFFCGEDLGQIGDAAALPGVLPRISKPCLRQQAFGNNLRNTDSGNPENESKNDIALDVRSHGSACNSGAADRVQEALVPTAFTEYVPPAGQDGDVLICNPGPMMSESIQASPVDFLFSVAHCSFAVSSWIMLLIQVFCLARTRAFTKFGIATAANTPMIKTAIMISIKV